MRSRRRSHYDRYERQKKNEFSNRRHLESKIVDDLRDTRSCIDLFLIISNPKTFTSRM